MNSEQVVAMIDAITEGKYYAHGFETKQDTITVEVGMANRQNEEEFWFSSFTPGANFLAKIDDPRTAREIAGALIAWANRREGESNGTSRAIEAMGYDPVATQQVAAFDANTKPTNSIPEGVQRHMLSELHVSPKSIWRADWYRRNVKNMSQETKDRNLKDLRGIRSTQEMTLAERFDIDEAIQILIDAGAK